MPTGPGHQAILEERMTAESFQQVEQMNVLLEHFGAKLRCLSRRPGQGGPGRPPGCVPGLVTRTDKAGAIHLLDGEKLVRGGRKLRRVPHRSEPVGARSLGRV